jgi:hypothetical protein
MPSLWIELQVIIATTSAIIVESFVSGWVIYLLIHIWIRIRRKLSKSAEQLSGVVDPTSIRKMEYWVSTTINIESIAKSDPTIHCQQCVLLLISICTLMARLKLQPLVVANGWLAKSHLKDWQQGALINDSHSWSVVTSAPCNKAILIIETLFPDVRFRIRNHVSNATKRTS